MRTLTLLFAALLMNACSTAKEIRDEKIESGEKVTEARTEFYRGEVSIRRAGRTTKTPVTMQLVTFEDQGKIEVSLHQKLKNEVRPLVFTLERIGTTEVFFIADQDKQVQGRVRFSGGEDWKWNQWAIGLTNPDRTAIAGAMVRDDSTADFKLKLQATTEKGRNLERVEGSFTFSTQEAYVATLQAWKSALINKGE